MEKKKEVIKKLYFMYMRAGIGSIFTKNNKLHVIQAAKLRPSSDKKSFIAVTEMHEEIKIFIQDIKEVYPAGITQPEAFWSKYFSGMH